MQNVTEAIGNKSTSLLEKLVTNPDLCNVVLGLLARCIVMCTNRGKPIEGIDIGPLNVEELTNGDIALRAAVTFRDVSVAMASMWPPQSDFAQYTRSKAHGLGMALQKNPKIAEFFQHMVERIDSYATHRHLQFEKLHVKQAILTTTDHIVLKVGKNILE